MCTEETNGRNPFKKKIPDLKLAAKVFQEAKQLMDPLPNPEPSSPDDSKPTGVITDSNGNNIFGGMMSGRISSVQIDSGLGAPFMLRERRRIMGLNKEARNINTEDDIPSLEIPNYSSSVLGARIIGTFKS